jgi:HK97 gp10 family phage protein
MPSIRAYAQAAPRSGSTGQFISARITPAIRAAVETSVKTVLEEAQRLVPVRTGELRDSGYTSVQEGDKTITGYVGFSADHAAYVEYGTGQRGAESSGHGPGPYSATWKGMPAQPYLRPALDATRETIREVMASQIALSLR